MKLWGGRSTKGTNRLVYNFDESLPFDQKSYHQDIDGSIAHMTILAKQGIVPNGDEIAIIRGLKSIKGDSEEGQLEFTKEYEDIHFFAEADLIARIGEAEKRLHTGRSRSDRIALDIELYCRDEIDGVDGLVQKLFKVLFGIMGEDMDTCIPRFTHLQKAQPITLTHHTGTCFEIFFRDHSRLQDTRSRMNYCPLGSGTLAGAVYLLDREYTVQLLGFQGPTLNSMGSVADWDYVIELLSALVTISMHLNRFCKEIIVWNINEYQFMETDDAYGMGSSIMPQKENPDIVELVRGKTDRVYGAPMFTLTTMKEIPLTYSKDVQEDKELTFNAIDTVKRCLALFTGMISTITFRNDVMENSTENGFTNATDVMDYLVSHGVPFRNTYGTVGQLVLYCIKKEKALDDMTLEELRTISPVSEDGIYKAVSMETYMKKCMTTGTPGQEAMKRVIKVYRGQLEDQ